jgi:hypothetical protein
VGGPTLHDALVGALVTDPELVREQLRTRLHQAMGEQYGEMPGPQAGMGPETGDGAPCP